MYSWEIEYWLYPLPPPTSAKNLSVMVGMPHARQICNYGISTPPDCIRWENPEAGVTRLSINSSQTATYLCTSLYLCVSSNVKRTGVQKGIPKFDTRGQQTRNLFGRLSLFRGQNSHYSNSMSIYSDEVLLSFITFSQTLTILLFWNRDSYFFNKLKKSKIKVLRKLRRRSWQLSQKHLIS